MKDLKIHATCQCRACRGEGFLANLAWNTFWEQMQAWDQAHPEPPAPRTWGNPAWAAWRDQQQEARWVIWSELGYGEPPAEEYPCPTCEGSGREVLQLPLAELARLLGIEKGTPAWLSEALNSGDGVYRP